MQDEIKISSPDKMVILEPSMEQDALTGRLKYEDGRSEPDNDMDTDVIIESGNITRNSPNIAVILKKVLHVELIFSIGSFYFECYQFVAHQYDPRLQI